MEIQQHDGMVVDAAVISAALRQALREGEGRGVAGEREAPRLQGAAALPPPLYIGPLGAAGPGIPSTWGAAAKGGKLTPQVRWGAPHP